MSTGSQFVGVPLQIWQGGRGVNPHLGHGAADAVYQVLEVGQAEERLLFESVQLGSKQILLVLQYGA